MDPVVHMIKRIYKLNGKTTADSRCGLTELIETALVSFTGFESRVTCPDCELTPKEEEVAEVIQPEW